MLIVGQNDIFCGHNVVNFSMWFLQLTVFKYLVASHVSEQRMTCPWEYLYFIVLSSSTRKYDSLKQMCCFPNVPPFVVSYPYYMIWCVTPCFVIKFSNKCLSLLMLTPYDIPCKSMRTMLTYRIFIYFILRLNYQVHDIRTKSMYIDYAMRELVMIFGSIYPITLDPTTEWVHNQMKAVVYDGFLTYKSVVFYHIYYKLG